MQSFLMAKDVKLSSTDESILLNKKKGEHKERELLILIKYFMLTGEFDLAKRLIKENTFTQLTSTMQRYNTLMDFMSGEYPKEIQSHPALCTIGIISRARQKSSTLIPYFQECMNNSAQFSQTNFLFIRDLINLNLNQKNSQLEKDLIIGRVVDQLLYQKENRDLNLLYLYYFENADVILNQISNLRPEFFISSKTRELIGLMYLQKSNLKKAMLFLNDIESVNTLNLKARLKLYEEKYTESFDLALKALERVPTSINALEILIPLSLKSQLNEHLLDHLNKLTTLTKETALSSVLKYKLGAKSFRSFYALKSASLFQEIKSSKPLYSLYQDAINSPYSQEFLTDLCFKNDLIACQLKTIFSPQGDLVTLYQGERLYTNWTTKVSLKDYINKKLQDHLPENFYRQRHKEDILIDQSALEQRELSQKVLKVFQ